MGCRKIKGIVAHVDYYRANATRLDCAVELRLERGEDVYVVLEVALVHRFLRPPHRHEQRTADQRVLLSLPLAGLPPGEIVR